MNDDINDIKRKLNLGATGRFPEGRKLDPSDKGELRSAVIT